MSVPATTSGVISADGVVTDRPARIMSVTLIPAAAASSIILYDNASAASGTVLAQLSAVANGASVHWSVTAGVVCNFGIYADITGASANAIVYYAAE